MTPIEIVKEYLDECVVYSLATEADGLPHVRPFGAQMIAEDGKLYFITANDKEVYRQMKANPRVEICAVKPDGLNWMRLQGTVEFHEGDDAEALQARMLEAKPPLKHMYSVGDGLMTMFALVDCTASFAILKTPHPKQDVLHF